MSADEAVCNEKGGPFFQCHVDGVSCPYADKTEDGGQLVHQSDVRVALGVFNNYCGFGNFYGRRDMNAGLND